MKKILISFLSLVGCVLCLQGQTRMGQLFVAMPPELHPLISRQTMDILLENYIEKKNLPARDELDATLRIDTICDNYMRLTTSPNSQFTLSLLQTQDSTELIVMVETVCLPAPDSHIRFFNQQWQELHWLEFPYPDADIFFPAVPDSLMSQKKAVCQSLRELPLMEIKADIQRSRFTLIMAIDELDKQQKKWAKEWIKPVEVKWNGNEFEMVKE